MADIKDSEQSVETFKIKTKAPIKSQFRPKTIMPNTRAKFGSPESNQANISALNLQKPGIKPSAIIKDLKNNLQSLVQFVEQDTMSIKQPSSYSTNPVVQTLSEPEIHSGIRTQSKVLETNQSFTMTK